MSAVCFARKNSHDCCAPSENVTEAQYVKNLGVIYEAAHAALAPGGKILWVSTTPAPTDGKFPVCTLSGRRRQSRRALQNLHGHKKIVEMSMKELKPPFGQVG